MLVNAVALFLLCGMMIESNKKNIFVITYNAPHRKTQDVVFALKSYGYKHVSLVAIPFVLRKKFVPIYQHRPALQMKIQPKDLAANFGYDFFESEIADLTTFFSFHKPDAILIAGSGLLPKKLVNSYDLINAHPGILPLVRGLDSLKWAIHKKKPLGVSVHILNEYADAGQLILKKELPLFASDSFHSVAVRQYEMEILLLIESLPLYFNESKMVELSTTISESTRRMPKIIEQNLLQEFQNYLQEFLEK